MVDGEGNEGDTVKVQFRDAISAGGGGAVTTVEFLPGAALVCLLDRFWLVRLARQPAEGGGRNCNGWDGDVDGECVTLGGGGAAEFKGEIAWAFERGRRNEVSRF